MAKVFISGSRSVKALPAAAIEALESITAKGMTVLIGDCWGVDTLVQRWLKQRRYHSVVVYHVASCRNNLGGWPTQAYFGAQTVKDRAMAADADHALVIWDGMSPGSQRNIAAMAGRYTKVIRV